MLTGVKGIRINITILSSRVISMEKLVLTILGAMRKHVRLAKQLSLWVYDLALKADQMEEHRLSTPVLSGTKPVAILQN